MLTVVTALAMATPAFAEDAPAPKSITINGLAEGDNVKYYKVVEWKSDGSGWGFVSPFDTALTEAQKTEILGSVKNNDDGTKEVVPGKITDTTAAAMGGATLGDAINGAGDTIASGQTSWSKTDQAPGLYMALITGAAPKAGQDMVVYNPVFLAVQSDNAGTELTLPLSYDDSGTAKKSTVTVDKTAKGPNDSDYAESTTQNVGDVIDFKVVTTVPAYLESWKSPTFSVQDTLSDGLTLEVKTEGDDKLSDITVATEDGTAIAATNYSVTDKTAKGYTITFTENYLKGLSAATKVVITYKAKITTDAANVNPETNTVKITYSNNPTDTSKHGEKEDKTTHYTFSIDAGLYGDKNYETSELVKVGVDAAGNPVTEEKTYHNGSKHNPLQGAEFAIYTDAGCKTPYTNSTIKADTRFTSDANGKLKITGLDEGTYYLKETKAATGYQLLTDVVSYTIRATYRDVAATDTCNAYKELAGYTVSVNGGATSTYVFENGAITKTGTAAGDQSTEIKNTQGNSLPSTGGMGTKILYTIGGLMVVAGGVFLAAKKRMSTIEE